MSNLIDVGRIAGVYGIKGWVKIHSLTEPASNLFDYQPWYIKTRHGVKPIELLEWRPHGKSYVGLFKGIVDRNQAEALGSVSIAVDRSVFPALPNGEFYWYELESCRVISIYNDTTIDLGVVSRVMATGANDVLVVVGDESSIDQQERLIPYVPEQFVKEVDLDKQRIVVDWDPEF
jgi:16S rRNA processing protein RimM